MIELCSLEHYQKVVRGLSAMPTGLTILNGEADDYPMEAFRDDIKEALRGAGLEYARMMRVRDFAKQCIAEGREPRRLHEPLVRVCQKIIDRHSYQR